MQQYPNWFYEGDAVYNETNVSRQGRGSFTFFLQWISCAMERRKELQLDEAKEWILQRFCTQSLSPWAFYWSLMAGKSTVTNSGKM